MNQKKYALLIALVLGVIAIAKTADQTWRMPHTGNVPGWGATDISQTAAVTGQLAPQNGGMPTGSMIAFGGTTAPATWDFTDGSSKLRTGTYAAMFAAIGCNYGCPDGAHFNLPDFRGVFMRGTNNMGTAAGAGTGDPDTNSRTASNFGGNTGDHVGSEQNYTNASHNHSGATFSTASHFHTTVVGNSSGIFAVGFNNAAQTWAFGSDVISTSNTGASANLNAVVYGGSSVGNIQLPRTSTASGGSGLASIPFDGGNEARPINAYVNYIIKE